MTITPIGTNLSQSFDVIRNSPTKISFNDESFFDHLADTVDFFIRKRLDSLASRHIGLFEHPGNIGGTDTIDIGKRNV